MNRRDFISTTGLKALTAWAGTSFLMNACHTEADMVGEPNWILAGDFSRPLNIPPVFNAGSALTAQVSTAELLKGKVGTTFAYGSGILGPTFNVNRGETVDVLLQNNLSDKTNIHWHGLIVPENMDGHPKDVAAPGGAIQYSLPVYQRAGTYWYHPHPHGTTARQVFMGLAGMFIVRDEEESALHLPSGEFEVPLILQDKHFDGNNLEYSPNPDEIMTGYLGEQIVVNGVHAPFLNVASDWYRFRVLNGSTARVYNLGLSDDLPFYIIGSDGGLLRTAEQITRIMLGPGERLDLLVDFSRQPVGKEIYLVSQKFSQYNVQGRQSFRLMKFRVDRTSVNGFTLPATLSDIPALNPGQSARTRSFNIATLIGGMGGHGGMGQHSINGKIFEIARVDETVAAGTTEVWEFDNRTGDEIHPMHIHGVQFQVLQRTGNRNKIIPSEKGWKDTVLLMPGEKTSVIMTFPEYRGLFVFHCHNLEHEDDGMMLNYEIV